MISNLLQLAHSALIFPTQRPFNIARAQEQHSNFRKAIEEHGHDCKTISIRQILERASHGNRAALEQLAASSLDYVAESDHVPESIQELLSDDYKRECLSRMSAEQLVDVVLTRPRVVLAPRSDVKATATEVLRNEFRPLSNLVFTRVRGREVQ
jgi:arginine deiminase